MLARLFFSALLVLLATSAQGDTRQAAVAEKFSEFRGQVVLVDFWASWCGPCRRSFPWMNAMQEKYGADGFRVIAVNVDKERAAANQFLDKYPAEFTVWYDPEGDLARTFNVSTMPTSFILDVSGQVRSAHRGFLNSDRDDYESAIAQILSDNNKRRSSES
jgi:thiol-disulfide isomerase/thioredoxin